MIFWSIPGVKNNICSKDIFGNHHEHCVCPVDILTSFRCDFNQQTLTDLLQTAREYVIIIISFDAHFPSKLVRLLNFGPQLRTPLIVFAQKGQTWLDCCRYKHVTKKRQTINWNQVISQCSHGFAMLCCMEIMRLGFGFECRHFLKRRFTVCHFTMLAIVV